MRNWQTLSTARRKTTAAVSSALSWTRFSMSRPLTLP
jgi:hypothetical protein